MLPGNLIGQIAEGKVIPVIIFAIFFGWLLLQWVKANTVRNFFDEFSHVMFKITRKIIRLSPYGILHYWCLLVTNTESQLYYHWEIYCSNLHSLCLCSLLFTRS